MGTGAGNRLGAVGAARLETRNGSPGSSGGLGGRFLGWVCQKKQLGGGSSCFPAVDGSFPRFFLKPVEEEEVEKMLLALWVSHLSTGPFFCLSSGSGREKTEEKEVILNC